MTQITTIISVLIGGGILGFVQFLISRKDAKDDKESTILSEIKTLTGKVEQIEKSLDERDAILYYINRATWLSVPAFPA